ncbi:MAG TPA: hypothetical protein VLA44_03000 [Clostridia bacterium]|nr:hypothetical protein [Clostridia bacterium]
MGDLGRSVGDSLSGLGEAIGDTVAGAVAGIGGAFASVPGGALWLVVLAVVVVVGWRLAR